jgi:hypothetical protein
MKGAKKLKNLSINSNLNATGSIFIDMDAKRREVEQLLSDKRNIERKIEHIQAECKHSKQVIKQVASESSFTIRHVCESCGSCLGYPTPEEIKKFLGT